MTGPLVNAVGSAAGPSITFNGNAGYGFFWDSTNTGIGISVGGVQSGFFTSTGPTYQSSAAISVQGFRYSSDASAPGVVLGKARGSVSAPAVPVTNDLAGNYSFSIWTGSAFQSCAQIRAQVTETSTVDSTHRGTRVQVLVAAIGSGTVAEIARFDNEAGLSMFGANPVISQNRNHVFRAYTVATLPTGVNAYTEAYVSDGATAYPTNAGAAPTGGGTNKRKVFTTDGTNWLLR
jgi:hypothetical protein